MPVLTAIWKRDIPRIGGSKVGFIALIVFLVVIIVVCAVSVFFLLRHSFASNRNARTRTRPRSRNRNRSHHRHQSVPSSPFDHPSSPSPLTSTATANAVASAAAATVGNNSSTHIDTTSKLNTDTNMNIDTNTRSGTHPSTKGWRWHSFFSGTTSSGAPERSTKGRGWIQTGSGEWDSDSGNENDSGDEGQGRVHGRHSRSSPKVREFRHTPQRLAPYAPPSASSPVSIAMEESPFHVRAPTSASARYSLSESIISSAHFDSPRYGHTHTQSHSHSQSHSNSQGHSYSHGQRSLVPASTSPTPPPLPRPILTTQLTSSPQSSPLPSPVPTPVPTSVHIPGRRDDSPSGPPRPQEARQDSTQSGLSVWTFQGGTKFIESL